MKMVGGSSLYEQPGGALGSPFTCGIPTFNGIPSAESAAKQVVLEKTGTRLTSAQASEPSGPTTDV